MVYYFQRPDGSEKRVSDMFSQAILTPEIMRDLLTSTGFKILEEMSNYTGDPIPDDPERPVDLIFVC